MEPIDPYSLDPIVEGHGQDVGGDMDADHNLESPTATTNDDTDSRHLLADADWCECGNCSVMPTSVECDAGGREMRARGQCRNTSYHVGISQQYRAKPPASRVTWRSSQSLSAANAYTHCFTNTEKFIIRCGVCILEG